ncbi:MAG TPA: glycosyltransferase family 2 protein [Chitinophagaceae bacterium]
MKISLCIPQYNRINFLLKNLEILSRQTYDDVEIVISDDCSTDDTEQQIRQLQKNFRYPIIYSRNPTNFGYDRNLRRSMELATGDYVFILGNDDSLNFPDSVQLLVDFLQKHDYPEVGFCNMVEAADPEVLYTRAVVTDELGTGPQIAFSYYSCFSFVGGIIFKRCVFNEFNTPKHDGSIYVQIYLASVMVSSGKRLFSIKEPLVLKDIQVDNEKVNSYVQKIAKSWKEFKIEEGGLPSVINVLISAFHDAGVLSKSLILKIFRRIYTYTFPNWIIDYKGKGSLSASVGLVAGMYPRRNSNFKLLGFAGKGEIYARYYMVSLAGLLFPYFLFAKLKNKLYALAKSKSR